MTLEEKAEAVEQVFKKLDEEIHAFQSSTGLGCKFGCGQCCFKPDIEATALEFLPFALSLYRKGLAFEWMEKLKNSNSPTCLILNPTQSGAGLCSQYEVRGLICRLFGYSARTDKYGKKELVTCALIKAEQSENFARANSLIDSGLPVPVMNQYYMQLLAIDNDLARNFYPINKAILNAIETVLHYFAYRDLA